MSKNGYTLYEVSVIAVFLGILTALAVPVYITISSNAKIESIRQIESSAQTANDFIHLKSMMPSFSTRPVPLRKDLIEIDISGDGNFDIRLKWFYLESTDLVKRIKIPPDVSVQYIGSDETYIGFAYNGDVKQNGCYFKYTQAVDLYTPPTYIINTTGC